MGGRTPVQSEPCNSDQQNESDHMVRNLGEWKHGDFSGPPVVAS